MLYYARGVPGGRPECRRLLNLAEGVHGRVIQMSCDAVPDRDRLDRDPCHHEPFHPGCVKGGCRAVRQFSGVTTRCLRETEVSILCTGGQSYER
jgi:hypothetical protein